LPKAPLGLRFSTRNVDEAFALLSQSLYRRIEVTGRATGFNFSLESTQLDLLSVSAMEISAGFRTKSSGAPSTYTLGRIETGGSEEEWDGHRILVGPGQGVLASPGKDIATRTHPLRATAVTIPAVSLADEVQVLTGETMESPLEIALAVDLSVRTFLGRQVDFFASLVQGNGLYGKGWDKLRIELQRRLISALVEHTPNRYQRILSKLHGGFAKRHVSRLEDYLDAHLTDKVTVPDMARAVGVNVRTLNKSCDRAAGKSPRVIYREMRLHAARRRFEKPQPQDTVASVALVYCFGHGGRFAEYYAALFGEMPEDTLHRGRRRARQ
jgi:AraC-like DNA-binding protein